MPLPKVAERLHDYFSFALWSKVHTFHPQLIHTWQMFHLSRLVPTVYESVELYRELWDQKTIKKIKQGGTNAFFTLPITTKQELREHPLKSRMVKGVEPQHYLWRTTSGSTGIPFEFPITSFYAPSMLDKRFLAFARYRFLTWDHDSRFRILDALNTMRLLHIGIVPYHTTPLNYRFIPIEDVRQNPQKVLEAVQDFRPTLLESTPSILSEVASITNSHSKENFHIPYIHSIGETLTETQRKYVANTFLAEVYDGYGLEEVGMVALECNIHEGLHISEESYLLEVVDSEGNSMPPGVSGRIILSFFWNEIMPFIRYDTGDTGFIVNTPCPCGIRARRIVVEGRTGGNVVFGTAHYNQLELIRAVETLSTKVLRFQWVYSETDIYLRLTLLENRDVESQLRTIQSHLAKTFKRVPRIELTTSYTYVHGKIPAVVKILHLENEMA